MPSLKPISFPRYSASLPNPGSVNNPDPSLRPLDPIFAIEPLTARCGRVLGSTASATASIGRCVQQMPLEPAVNHDAQVLTRSPAIGVDKTLIGRLSRSCRPACAFPHHHET